MRSYSQENSQRSVSTYIYIFAGALSSLLMLFLVRQSLPLNQKEAKEYYQNIKATKQEIRQLQKTFIQSNSTNYLREDNILPQLKATETALAKLKDVPDIFPQQEQNIIQSQIETQEALLLSQSQLIEQFNNTKAAVSKSCLYLPQLKTDLKNNPGMIGGNLTLNSQLVISLDDLLDNIIIYCYRFDSEGVSIVEGQIQQIDILLNQPEFKQYNFAVDKFTNYGKDIIAEKQQLKDIVRQIELGLIEEKLIELENEYHARFQSSLQKVSTYRLLTALLFLAIAIVIAYTIINNLAKTNRNIVKVLEGFTQELETKVEKRTAQLEESIQNTEAALTQAQNANKAKSRFLANMSHELRTPLNAILGFTQLMCRDASISPEHQENIQIINRSGEHLLKLINDILEMSKIEVGQITLNETRFDLYIMLKSIEEMLRLKAKAKGLDLIFEIDDNIPKYICTDEGKLRQIIINLLGNALKFTKQGSIALRVKIKENTSIADGNIDFLFSDTYALHFAVEDTGPGIAAEEMKQLFSPFEQTKVGRISNEGTGLGLSICYKFVELMGGELKVTSTVGKGSTFFFKILIKLEDTNSSHILQGDEPVDSRRAIAIAQGQPEYRILAVDDVAASRLLLRKMLTDIGFAVAEAGDGREAVEQWSKWHPDLILMDMRMPVMDGYEATRQIKSQPQGKETIIIALTASAFEEERVVILSAGCDDFMRKPFYETELLTKIGQYLNVEYVYEEAVAAVADEKEDREELTQDSLAVMSLEWRSQLYEAAAKVDNQEILQLLAQIPQEYESLAKELENLVEHFRCDKIIDLTASVDQ